MVVTALSRKFLQVLTVAWIKLHEATKKLKKFGDDIVTTESDKDQKIEQFSLNFEAYAQAISAANGFLENLDSGSKVEKV